MADTKKDLLEGKVAFLDIGVGKFYGDLETLAVAYDGFDQDVSKLVEASVVSPDLNIVADKMSSIDGRSSSEIANFIVSTKAMSLFFESGDRIYAISNDPVEDFKIYYSPAANVVRSMRDDSRRSISNRINDAYYKGKTPDKPMNDMCVLYSFAIEEAIKRGEKTPAKAGKAGDGAAGTGAGTEKEVIIRETVVEKETPPVLEGMLRQAICEMMAQVAIDDMVPRVKQKIIDEFGFEPVKHEVKVLDEEHHFEGVTHEAFDHVLHCIANDLPVYLYGPAGSGKNVLTEQCAKAMNLDYYFMNSVTDEYKISGFIDANGIYHETAFYEAFTKGGVFFLDEVDASASEVLVCLNAAIANRYFQFPTGPQKAHENFRVVAAGNTLGTGADAAYTGRMQLDAASLNRFVIIPVDYDRRIDMFNAQNDEELCDFIADYRKSLKSCGLSGVASYRNISQIKALEPVMDLEHALAYALTKEMNKDDINTMIGRDLFDTSNRYFKALRNIESIIL